MPLAEQLSGELHRYERLISDAIASGGRLTTLAIETRASERRATTAGHQIIMAIGDANRAASEALCRAAQAHKQLEVLGKLLGHPVTDYGDGTKPDQAFFTQAALDDVAVAGSDA